MRYVDDIISEDDWEGKFDFLKEHCDVVYLGRTQNISNLMILELSPTIDGLGQNGSNLEIRTPCRV